MGGCLSTERHPSGTYDAANHQPASIVAAHIRLSTDAAWGGKAGGNAGCEAPPPHEKLGPAAPPAVLDVNSISVELVAKVYALQQALALISGHPLLALPEAADLIAEHTGVDLVGICAYDPADPDCAALLAAAGRGAELLEHCILMRGAEWSAGCLAASGSNRVVVPDALQAAAELPTDFAGMHQSAGLRSFAAVSVGAPGGRPLAALLLASTKPGYFNDASASLWMTAAATGLLQHTRPPAVPQAVRCLRAINEAETPVDAISELLQGAERFMKATTNLSMGIRLALVESERQDALIFESALSGSVPINPRSGCATPTPPLPLLGGPGGGGGSQQQLALQGQGGGSAGVSRAVSPFGAVAGVGMGCALDVNVRQMSLQNTLLASAVSMRQARFIADAVPYLQNNPCPARDVFAQSSGDPVASIIVIPLLASDDAPLGALYFTQAAPCEFDNVRGALLGFVHCVSLSLEHKLAGQMGTLQAMATMDWLSGPPTCVPTAPGPAGLSPRSSIGLPSDSPPPSAASSGTPTPRSVPTPRGTHPGLRPAGGSSPRVAGGYGDGGGARSGAPSPPPGGAGGGGSAPVSRTASSSRLFRVSSGKHIGTEGMVKALRNEIQRRDRYSFEATELVLIEPIGAGGFGQVYRGLWHRRPAAIKVLQARGNEGAQAVSDAMEMAVLSSVVHPNIVQVYSCKTDMVEVPPPAPSPPPPAADGGGGASPRQLLCPSPALGPVYRAPRFRRLQPGEDGDEVPTFNVIVMEHCDRGTLADAVMRSRVFHQPQPDGSIGVNLPALLEVLIAVAHSLQYLHGIGLVHGDVKMDNVLLKSDPAVQPLGFVPKLADFGLSRLLKDSHDVINLFGAGTATHLAPELLQAGTRITTAADVYAFGILMAECYSARRAFAGLPRATVIERVLRHGARPPIPPAAPPAFSALAAACWAPTPEARPGFPEVVDCLQRLADGLA